MIMFNFHTELRLWRLYGRANDSLEFTLLGGAAYRIDLFFMYNAVNPPKADNRRNNEFVPSRSNDHYTWMGTQTFDDYKKVKG